MTTPDLCPECGSPMGEVEPSSHVCGGWVCEACGYIDTHPHVCTCCAGVLADGPAHFFECPCWSSSSDDEDSDGMDYEEPSDWQDACCDGSGRRVTCDACDDYDCPDNPESWLCSPAGAGPDSPASGER